VRVKVPVGFGFAVVLATTLAGSSAGLSDGSRDGAQATVTAAAARAAVADPTARVVASASATPTPTPAPAQTATSQPSASATEQSDVTNHESLPVCSFGDVKTPLTRQSDWALTLVDTNLAVPNDYAPGDLVGAYTAGIPSYQKVRSILVPELTDMAAAASAAGAPLDIVSGYRDYWTQVETFAYWVNEKGVWRALVDSARPGHSEHQLGLAVDFASLGGVDPWNVGDFATDTPAGKWLFANAWRYGFVLSYPNGATSKTCYEYEPWHYRYVGVTEAAAVRDSGLTLREWLWRRQPNPEPASPMLSPSPSPRVSAGPSASPVP
jgi:D-alanyl-D-alanine carboxypeptidase